LTHFKQNY